MKLIVGLELYEKIKSIDVVIILMFMGVVGIILMNLSSVIRVCLLFWFIFRIWYDLRY